MRDDEIGEKFVRLTRETLSQKQAQNVVKLLWNLEEIDDVAEIFKAVVV